MIPKSLSATAMDVATKCMARYAAENFDRADKGDSGMPAMLGSACHNALEFYVKAVYIEKVAERSWDLLLTYYKMHYTLIFDTMDTVGPVFDDGVEMLKNWFERTDLSDVNVLSVEAKEPFPVKVTDKHGVQHHIPFNYIFDRLDQLDEDTYRVVDYKTVRWGYGPDELRLKLQARAYAVAAQIKFPHAKRIWVVFDLLRHDAVGTVFTKEENANTYRYIRKWAKNILDTDYDLTADPPINEAKESINDECKFCIRKAVCGELMKNRAVGGVVGLSMPELVDRRALIQGQVAALKSLETELDDHLKALAQHDDLETLSSNQNEVYWARSKRRAIERIDVLEGILGPALFERVGSKSVTMGKLDMLLKPKDNTLTPEQKAQVKALIRDNYGEPYVKTRSLNKIDPK